jgi:flagellin-like hook-associated protein FlgL
MAVLPLQLARVSNQLRISVATSTIARTQQELLKVQNELSTGKKLIAPSDNPGDAAIAQQLRKLLESRDGYATNLLAAKNQLSEVDSSLADLSGLVQEAQTLASANVGSDVTPDARISAATVIDELYTQLLTIGNHQFEGSYIFAGDRSTDPPFAETPAGVTFRGNATKLNNTFNENVVLPFSVDGAALFGAIASRVEGSADISPAITTATRLSELRGASGDGIRKGSILISNGTTSATIDLSNADSVGDVIDAINAAGIGSITAGIASGGTTLELTAGGSDDISINEVGGGKSAADLGILQTSGAGAGNTVTGLDVQARVTPFTQLADLNGGAGIDTSGLIITNGLTSTTVDLSSATTVQDMLNAINGAGVSVRAEINAAGTGINIYNPTQGADMRIGENGGTTAADLGVRSFGTDSALSELNYGKGVGTVSGADIQIVDSNGVSFTVDLTGLSTIQDVINAINTASTGAGAAVAAGFKTTGNGLTLTDTGGGSGAFSLTPVNYSTAAADLGLVNPASGTLIEGDDVNPVEPSGIFSHFARLRDALRGNNQAEITAAAELLQADFDRVVRIRGETGARLQDVESRQGRLEDQNIATKALLSSLEDSDFTDAVTRFQTLQTALQASLQTSAKILNLSLLDFLG